ncbi:MAG: T9SS type A sorting domain-containing protein [Saprospiraceae bacterium]|nr:T9SS type A sorting domain-containing protein [Saprospiraceae bacterium]
MRKQTLLGLLVAIYWCGQLTLVAQNRSIYLQDPSSTHVAIEAEAFSIYFDHNPGNTNLQSWNVINDNIASGTQALRATGGVQGNNGRGIDALQDAKATYYVQFARSGTYHLYIRYKNANGGSSLYIPDGFGRALRSFSPNLPNSSPAGQFRWQKLELQARGEFPGTYVVQDKDLGKALTFNFWPREPNFELDRFVLSQRDDLTPADLDAIANTPNRVPPYRRNLLQYTSFEGLNQELGVLSSTSSFLTTFPGNLEGEFFPYLGRQALYLNQTFGGAPPQVTFRPVRLDCYSESQVCFRWFSPAAIDDEFEASDRFRASLIFQDEGGNLLTSYPVLDIPGEGIQQIDVLGDGYLEYCYTIHDDSRAWPLPDDGASPTPRKATHVSLQFTLTASEDNEDIVIDEVYFTTKDPNPVDAAIDQLEIQGDNKTINVDAAGSVGGFLYVYAFSDGSLAPPQRDPNTVMAHTFATPGSYGVSLYALDECGNIRDVDLRTVSSLLPVEWDSFAAKPKAKDVHLNWTTQTESNNDYFQVEWSDNGKHFKPLGTIKGQGNSQVVRGYSFVHKEAGFGLHYYRIKQVDFDGSWSYSPIQTANIEAKELLTFFPNPVDDQLQIILSGDRDLQIKVIDMQGRPLLKQWITNGPVSLSMENLAPGIYFVQYVDAAGALRNWKMVKK